MLWSATTAAIQAVHIPMTLMSMLQLNGSGLLYPKQSHLKNNSIFDYIVVGAGTAGCVVGTRLVENNFSTLLLEYGDDPPLEALAAALFVSLPKSHVDYDHKSTYDTYAARSQGNFTILTAGKMLGGSNSLNHFIHTRGCSIDFDEWANISGEDSWKYEEFLQYFIRSERLDDAEILSKYPQYHGTDGPIGISRQLSEKAEMYLQALAEVGFPSVLDLNGNKFTGFTQPQFTLADKVRQTPARSYLKKVLHNPNLYISKNTKVTRIIFEDKIAKAVEAIYNGDTYVFRANKEIILSAGVYNSPQILMLSGVGPKEHLAEMGIEIVVDLPVGNDFIDHVSTTLVFKTESHLPMLGLSKIDPDVTRIPFPLLVGFAALDMNQKCADYVTFGLILPNDTPFVTLTCRSTLWYREDVCDSWQEQVKGRDSFYVMLLNVNPKSRGTIRLNSIDPFDEPRIETGFYTNSEDVENMVRYTRDILKVEKSSFFKNVGAELLGLDLPECSMEELRSDNFWRCYLKNRAISSFHGVGTCAMGSVVDGLLGNIGLKNIRVADASVMPVITKGTNNAAVIALAEKAADMIMNKK